MGLDRKNVLLVEGSEDKRVIPELIEANGIDWGTKKNPIVYIRDCGEYEQLIAPKFISAGLKKYKVSALVIIINADEEPGV